MGGLNYGSGSLIRVSAYAALCTFESSIDPYLTLTAMVSCVADGEAWRIGEWVCIDCVGGEVEVKGNQIHLYSQALRYVPRKVPTMDLLRAVKRWDGGE